MLKVGWSEIFYGLYISCFHRWHQSCDLSNWFTGAFNLTFTLFCERLSASSFNLHKCCIGMSYDLDLMYASSFDRVEYAGEASLRTVRIYFSLTWPSASISEFWLMAVWHRRYNTAQLSNLWRTSNSVRKGFGPAMKTGSSRRFKRYPTTYMWVSSWLPFTVD